MSFAQAVIDIYGSEIPDVNTYLSKYGGALLGSLDMNQHSITDLPTPVSSNDAANKQYIDDAISGAVGTNFVHKAGDTMTGNLVMSQNKVTSLADATSDQDAVSKRVMEARLLAAMQGNLNMNAYKITSLADPSSSLDAVNYETLLSYVYNYLPLAGGVLTGNLTTNAKITFSAAASTTILNITGTSNQVDGNNKVILTDSSSYTFAPTNGATSTIVHSATPSVSPPISKSITSYYSYYSNPTITGVVSNVYGLYTGGKLNSSAASVTNYYGVYGDSVTVTSGSLSNVYSGYFTTPASGASRTALYADNMCVGVTTFTPSTGNLHISGVATFGGTTNKANKGLTININNSATYAANTDILDANRSFNVYNSNTSANTYCSLTMRTSGNNLLSQLDMILASTGSGNSSCNWTFNANGTVTTRYTFDSSGNMTINGGTLNMSSNKIVSLATPTTSTDAATKGYVDGLMSFTTGRVPFAGASGLSSDSGLVWDNTNKILEATKMYVGTSSISDSVQLGVNILSGTFTGIEQIGSLSSLSTYNEQYGVNLAHTFAPPSSATMYSLCNLPTLNMSSNNDILYGQYNRLNITGAYTLTNSYGVYVHAGSSSATAVTNSYGLYVNNPAFGTNKTCAYFNGNTSVNGTLDVNSNKIVNVATPTASTDAVNKAYVDSIPVYLSIPVLVARANIGTANSWAGATTGFAPVAPWYGGGANLSIYAATNGTAHLQIAVSPVPSVGSLIDYDFSGITSNGVYSLRWSAEMNSDRAIITVYQVDNGYNLAGYGQTQIDQQDMWVPAGLKSERYFESFFTFTRASLTNIVGIKFVATDKNASSTGYFFLLGTTLELYRIR